MNDETTSYSTASAKPFSLYQQPAKTVNRKTSVAAYFTNFTICAIFYTTNEDCSYLFLQTEITCNKCNEVFGGGQEFLDRGF